VYLHFTVFVFFAFLSTSHSVAENYIPHFCFGFLVPRRLLFLLLYFPHLFQYFWTIPNSLNQTWSTLCVHKLALLPKMQTLPVAIVGEAKSVNVVSEAAAMVIVDHSIKYTVISSACLTVGLLADAINEAAQHLLQKILMLQIAYIWYCCSWCLLHWKIWYIKPIQFSVGLYDPSTSTKPRSWLLKLWI